MERPRGEKGQILIPALFVFPMLFLIMIFVIDVAQLSRGKIRHQFALDAGASLEMGQYTDMVNRMAYINGVFPDRIFQEMYTGSWDSYYKTGLFPGFPGDMSNADDRTWGTSFSPGGGSGAVSASGGGGAVGTADSDYSYAGASFGYWPLQYGPGRAGANVPDPPLNFGILHMHLPDSPPVTLKDATAVAAGYITAYQWLGDVAASHKIVFENLTLAKHTLLRKGMYLNLQSIDGPSGCPQGPDTCGDEAASGFGPITIRMHYVSGFKHCPVIVTIQGSKYKGELSGPFNFSGSGLFQLTTVPESDLKTLENGYVVKQHWIPPPNYFGIDLLALDAPYVRASVTTAGGYVWPNSTPKYFTKLWP